MMPVDLDAIDARTSAATRAPWKRQASLSIDSCVESEDGSIPGVPMLMVDVSGDRSRADADFIAHARADVPAMSAELRQLREQLVAIDAINEDDWENGEAASWVNMIRNGVTMEDLRAAGMRTQQEHEQSLNAMFEKEPR